MTIQAVSAADGASVLLMARDRAAAAPVLDHFTSQGVRCEFMRPRELANESRRLFAWYRLAVVLDIEGDPELREIAKTLSDRLPCIMVSAEPPPSVHAFRAVLDTDTSPGQLLSALRTVMAIEGACDELVGTSVAMQQLRHLIERVAHSSVSVLLQGESGTGKASIAREIHRRSARRGAFVALDCGAMTPDILEFELFGTAKDGGDAAGARGCLARASGGTLFLDAIGDMPVDSQAKLLRAIKQGLSIRPDAGGQAERDVPGNVRIVAAARRDLALAVEQGGFLADLYFRLAVFPIRVPPLRERSADIDALVSALSWQVAGRRPLFDHAAICRLQSHSWPGNMRELSSLVERLAILHPGQNIDRMTLDAQLALHRPGALAPAGDDNDGVDKSADGAGQRAPAARIASMVLPAEGVELRTLVEAFEKRLIEQALERQSGVVAHAARTLGLRRTTLIEKLRRYAINGY